MRRPPARVAIDRGLLKLIVAFVLVQTWASLVGGLITPGGIPVSAEIYYFIQRAHFLFIPLIALELRLSHRLVLSLLVTGCTAKPPSPTRRATPCRPAGRTPRRRCP